jgi:Tfp pilus assembly protein PilV
LKSIRDSIRNLHNPAGSEDGIGLVEIIIAMLIFSIGISVAIQTLPVSNVSTTRSRNITLATNLAQEKIEELKAVPFSHADLAAGGHTDPDNPLERHFTRSWNVTDDVPLTGMKELDVTVSFNAMSADSSVTLTTYITSRR